MKGMQLGGLLGFFDPDHLRYESRTSIANFSSNLPVAFRREDQPSSLQDRIAVTVRNGRTQRRRQRIESSAVLTTRANKSNIGRIRIRTNRNRSIRRSLNFTTVRRSI